MIVVGIVNAAGRLVRQKLNVALRERLPVRVPRGHFTLSSKCTSFGIVANQRQVTKSALTPNLSGFAVISAENLSCAFQRGGKEGQPVGLAPPELLGGLLTVVSYLLFFEELRGGIMGSRSVIKALSEAPKTDVRLIGSLLLLAIFSMTIAAQQPPSASGASRIDGPSTSVGDTRYRIGAGDVLTIQVRKTPELSGIVRVDQRGMIRIPMIEGDVQAACRTESELSEQIATLYLQYKKNPSVEVFVTEFQSRPVAVIGAVNAPGQFRLQRQVRLNEMLTFAGGPATRAGRTINIIHTGGPSICRTETEAEKADPVKELSFFRLAETMQGKEGANPFILPGDIVAIPEAEQVFIIGHVAAPQAIFLRDKPITVSRAIATAGGTARDASTSRVRIIRQGGDGVSKQEIFVDLKAVLKLQAEDIALMPNDIVEVGGSASKTILGALTGAIAPALTQVPVRMIP
jgi:polysaccharide export outer membrane protein